MTRRRFTIGQALTAYQRDRRGVVVAQARLLTAVKRLRYLRNVSAQDRAAVARAVQRHIARRRAARVSDSTIRRELIVLRAALRHAWKRGRLAHQPYVASPSPSPPRQRWLSPEEARRLLHEIDDRLDLCCQLALRTGARLGAILDLTWDRVDFVAGVIDYRAPHPQADRRKARAVVPITPGLRKMLRVAHAAAGDEPRVVPFSHSFVQRRIKTAAEAAGLAGVTAHTLRHTAATWLLGEHSGVSLVQASRLLGHRSVAITEQVYAHLISRHLRGAADALAELVEDEPL